MLADRLSATYLHSFAEWRWNTLGKVCQDLKPCLDSVVAHFDPEPFARGRERSLLNRMLTALRSRFWRLRFNFIIWFTDWLCGLTQWASGCACHEELLRRKEKVDCPYKGRRLPEAYGHAMSTLRDGLKQANEWSAYFWGLPGDWAMFQGCVRNTFLQGSRKFDFLDKVPWLIARLAEPGVRDRVRAQWAGTAAHHHHRATVAFMTEFGAELDLIGDDGEGISERLSRELKSWCCIPLDDSVAEAPHAIAKRISQHARHAGLAWVAASTRLDHNLKDVRTLPGALDIDFSLVWTNYKSVLQPERSKHPGRPVKHNFRRCCDELYTIGFARHGSLAAPVVGGAGGGGGGGGGGGAGDAGEDADVLGTSDDASDDDDDDGDGGPGLVGRHAWSRDDEEVKLVRQWLAQALVCNAYYSISLPHAGEDEPKVLAFQVLNLEHSPSLIRTFADHTDESGKCLYSMSAQNLEIWSTEKHRLCFETDVAGLAHMEVFRLEDPVVFDPLSLMGDNLLERSRWKAWTSKTSDLEGCMALVAPTDVAPACTLNDDHVPVLSLLDALLSAGYTGHHGKIVHTKAMLKQYDKRSLPSKMRYLQCVLSLEELLASGVHTIHSDQPQPYYALILKTKMFYPPKLGAKEYKRLLAAREGDEVALSALTKPAPKKARVEEPPPPAHADSDGSIAGDDTPDKPPTAADSSASSSSTRSSSTSSCSTSRSSAESSSVICDSCKPPDGFPLQLLGQKLHRIKGRGDEKWNYSNRLRIKCPAHEKCRKSRSVALDVPEFGAVAPVIFLGSWLSARHMPAEEHRKHRPSKKQMREFASGFVAPMPS